MAVLLAATAAVLLVAGGLGLWAHAGWWRGMAVAGLATSFALMIVYFSPWYLFIQGVNAALIEGIVWLTWPSKTPNAARVPGGPGQVPSLFGSNGP